MKVFRILKAVRKVAGQRRALRREADEASRWRAVAFMHLFFKLKERGPIVLAAVLLLGLLYALLAYIVAF